jgi:hypothetical protein
MEFVHDWREGGRAPEQTAAEPASA